MDQYEPRGWDEIFGGHSTEASSQPLPQFSDANEIELTSFNEDFDIDEIYPISAWPPVKRLQDRLTPVLGRLGVAAPVTFVALVATRLLAQMFGPHVTAFPWFVVVGIALVATAIFVAYRPPLRWVPIMVLVMAVGEYTLVFLPAVALAIWVGFQGDNDDWH